MKYRITIAGLGYVGMSLAVLLARHHRVCAIDLDYSKVDQVNSGYATVADEHMQDFMNSEELFLSATSNAEEAYKRSDYVIVATPTDYDPDKNFFDTSSVEQVVRQVRRYNSEAMIVIKSTIPVGFSEKLRADFGYKDIIFSPEFLREGSALYDNLYPSRIIVGSYSPRAYQFAKILREASDSSSVSILKMGSTEAEAVKLFANTYLAMRVSFFNELDTFGLSHNLNVKEIIEGVCLDPRIKEGYNNPSFGYGGYCLPKDTKQLLANYQNVPQRLIQGIVESNAARAEFIAKEIAQKNIRTVGIYRLTMKQGSDNTRSSAVDNVICHLFAKNVQMTIFEPLLSTNRYLGIKVESDFDKFIGEADLVVCNRIDAKLKKHEEKVFSRDIFGTS